MKNGIWIHRHGNKFIASPFNELTTDELSLFVDVPTQNPFDKAHPSIITLIGNSFSEYRNTSQTSSATISSISHNPGILFNTISLPKASDTLQPSICNQMSYYLSDYMFFLVDSVEMAALYLAALATTLGAFLDYDGNFRRPGACVLIYGKKHQRILPLDEEDRIAMLRRALSELQGRSGRSVDSYFSNMHVYTGSVGQDTRPRIPARAMRLVVASGYDRKMKSMLWSLDTLSTLQQRLLLHITSSSDKIPTQCQLLYDKSRIGFAEKNIWSMFCNSNSTKIMSESLAVWGRCIAWEILKQEHVYQAEDAFEQCFRMVCRSLLTEAKLRDVDRHVEDIKRSVKEGFQHYTSQYSSTIDMAYRDDIVKYQSFHLRQRSLSSCMGCKFVFQDILFSCGHGFCQRCLYKLAAGTTQNTRYHIIFDACIVCTISIEPIRINIRPPTMGTRILCLDGGGIFGIVELLILDHLEQRIRNLSGYRFALKDYFDDYVGTSTGGLIALGLGKKHWAVHQAMQWFLELASHVFPSQSSWTDWLGSWTRTIKTGLNIVFYNGIFSSESASAAFKLAYGEGLLLDRSVKDTESCTSIRTAVVSTTAAEGPGIFTDYHRPQASSRERDASYYGWFNQDGPNVRTHEAASCTSAAPMYFQAIELNGRRYSDGGLSEHNCPVDIALNENSVPVGICISIGCGTFERTHASLESQQTGVKGLFQRLVYYAAYLINSQRQFLKVQQEARKTRENMKIMRLNPVLRMSPVGIHQSETLPIVGKHVRNILQAPDPELHRDLEDATWTLFANCYYIDLIWTQARRVEGQWTLAIKILSVDKDMTLPNGTFFVIDGQHITPDSSKQVFLTASTMDQMINVQMCSRAGQCYPISGCPRTMNSLVESCMTFKRGSEVMINEGQDSNTALFPRTTCSYLKRKRTDSIPSNSLKKRRATSNLELIYHNTKIKKVTKK